MKPGKTFKLSKTTKRMIALMGGTAESRNQYKRMMIDAQLCGAVVVKREPRDNKNGPRGTGYVNTATSATPSA
jgi:hypothetical protein